MRDTHEHQNDPTFQDAMKAFNNKASCFETEFHEIQYCQICNEHIEQEYQNRGQRFVVERKKCWNTLTFQSSMRKPFYLDAMSNKTQ